MFLSPEQGQGPYAAQLKKIEVDIKEIQKRVNEKLGLYILYSSSVYSFVCRCQGIGHWFGPSQPLGYSRGQTAHE